MNKHLKKRNRYKPAGVVAVVTLIILAGCEIFLWLFLQFPRLNNYFPYFKKSVAEVYFNFDVDMVQFMPGCARYDPELFYTLRPGSFIHKAREFKYECGINNLGLRDDDASLERPEIVMLGDSYGMGWGVEQESTYAQLVEHYTGLKVLNAGVSSYGTAREMLLLNRIDLTKVKYVVVQYCNNDFSENKIFAENGFHLPVQSESVYEAITDLHQSRCRYKPLLYLSTFLNVEVKERLQRKISYIRTSWLHCEEQKLTSSHQFEGERFLEILQKNPLFKIETPASVDEETDYFLAVLSSQGKLHHVKLIVLFADLNAKKDAFMNSLEKKISEDNYPGFIHDMQLLHTETFLGKDDYYTLDSHLNASGHKKIALRIAEIIRRDVSHQS